jgi:hypothetical protein
MESLARSVSRNEAYLPNPDEIRDTVDSLSPAVEFTAALAMKSHIKFLATKSNLRIICTLLDLNGQTCGGMMDIAVDRNGAFYQCRVDPQGHRIPV